MISERRKCRFTFYFCLSLILALQSATPSLALPALYPGPRSDPQENCPTVHVGRDTLQPVSGRVARLLGQQHVHDFLLPLPMKETGQTESALPDGEEDKDASCAICQGVWSYRQLPPNALKLYGAGDALDSSSERSGGRPTALYLLLSSEMLSEISLRGNVSLTLTCSKSLSYCFNIFCKDCPPSEVSHPRLLRRSVDSVKSSHNFPTGTRSHASLVVTGAAAVLSLVVLISLVALCAGSSSYDPPQAKSGVTLQKGESEAPSSEVTVQFQSPKKVQVEVETASGPAAATNGTVGEKAAATDNQTLSPKHKDTADPRGSLQREEGSDRETRSRTLSARSFDPLPEIPKLDTAEDEKAKRSKDSPASNRGAGGDMDEDDEAGYAYARVGGAAVRGMAEADSDKDDKSGSGSVGQSSNLPPYGKVSHHVTKPKVNETEEYAEVKEVFRGPIAVDANRTRSATDPIDPAEAKLESVREKRALTHTHMMPLPAVPKPPVGAEENQMYDSIPDDMRESQVPLPQAAVAAPKLKLKERLYESMDDMEDTYESVPDNLKPDSPVPISPGSPTHSPNIIPIPGSSTSPPLPPSSPVPKPQSKEPEKKPVEKTLSASQVEGDGKRRFSFFGRKKTSSVSAAAKKEKKDKEKHGEKDHKDHHVPHQPLPNVPALSPVTSPPLPPIPANEDDDDTMYDTPQLDFMTAPARESPGPSPISPSGVMDAKARSQSLPSSARGAGAAVFHGPRINIPLPRVPEDSGQGVVVRERVLESPFKGEEDEKPYDSVTVPHGIDREEPYDTVKVADELEDINEPNYDTVDKEEILKAVAAESAENEPGYDRVKKLDEEESEGQREREKATAPSSTEAGGAGIKYGKVTRPLSPEDDTPGILPEHDEEGYAVVPDEFKMRKRALSASQGTQPKINVESPKPVRAAISEAEESTSPGEPTEPYASVDIIAKKQSKEDKTINEKLAAENDMSPQRSPSPIPPPVPPVGELGDDVVNEFSEPPVPIQSEDVLELVSPDASSSLKPPGSDDPPYAKVKSKDHPYAELDLGGGGELAKLTTAEDTANRDEVGYDEVGVDVNKPADLKDQALGYDTVADSEVNHEAVEDEALGYNTVGSAAGLKTIHEPTAVYDTVIDSDKDRAEEAHSPTNELERETPKLAMVEPPQQLYDSLETVEEADKGGEEAADNLYDSLEPEPPQQNGVDNEAAEEERYEEIDDERRMELITKQREWSQRKSS